MDDKNLDLLIKIGSVAGGGIVIWKFIWPMVKKIMIFFGKNRRRIRELERQIAELEKAAVDFASNLESFKKAHASEHVALLKELEEIESEYKRVFRILLKRKAN